MEKLRPRLPPRLRRIAFRIPSHFRGVKTSMQPERAEAERVRSTSEAPIWALRERSLAPKGWELGDPAPSQRGLRGACLPRPLRLSSSAWRLALRTYRGPSPHGYATLKLPPSQTREPTAHHNMQIHKHSYSPSSHIYRGTTVLRACPAILDSHTDSNGHTHAHTHKTDVDAQ